MSRFAALLVCVPLCGCGDPSAQAPMLTLKIERQDGRVHSIGRYRVFHTGVVSESSDSAGQGTGRSQRVTIQEISGDLVTLTFESSGGAGGDFSEEISLRHGDEIKVDLPDQTRLIAELEAAD